jgi:hypothetical protein
VLGPAGISTGSVGTAVVGKVVVGGYLRVWKGCCQQRVCLDATDTRCNPRDQWDEH